MPVADGESTEFTSNTNRGGKAPGQGLDDQMTDLGHGNRFGSRLGGILDVERQKGHALMISCAYPNPLTREPNHLEHTPPGIDNTRR